ncbi:hypothetical protein C7S18_05685 [Ahniella affigens]|uniref:Uncharacterized protein n=1 Tax=Ahniella affigens TaxID=2021234 RepID=A0A2P1PPE9_9GAMM|nr:hypothetical protein [Ahniella affigens]AVP96723.1 hypothetical protein C7S18_05685 [Ahniella affigens]
MKRIASLLFTAAVSAVSLTGCVVYDGYGYYEDDYYGDDHYDSYDSYRPARSYGPSYSTTIRYSNYSPDYIYWSGYYSALWPTYRYYYDPIFCPDFYYGVTYFPVSYFGIHYSRYQWPYYHAYSPYRYSYYDNYYDWRWRRSGRGYYDNYNNYPSYAQHRFGSARNESERIAAYTGMDRYRGLASPGVQAQPYDRSHVFGWRNDGVQGHYPDTSSGPRPYFQQANVDPMDWRVNPPGGRGYDVRGQDVRGQGMRGQDVRGQDVRGNGSVGRYSGGAYNESTQIQRQSGGWREPANENTERPGFSGDRGNVGNLPQGQGTNPRSNWREPPQRESGWVSEAPPMRQPSQIQRESSPRFEQPEQRFERGGNRFERSEPSTWPSQRTEQPQVERYEMPQRSEPRFERSEPRYEAPQRSEPRFEMPQRSEPRFERSEPRFEAPQRSEPRFEMPQRSEPRFERSEPRFEAPQRSEPRFEAPQRSEPSFERSSNDDGGSARQESMRMSRGDDREQ